jgi:CSLREA domain-containing protein
MKNTNKTSLSISGLCLILLTVLFSVSQAHAQGGSIVVNTLADGDDTACNEANCTLREAVKYAPAGSTISFSVTGIITLTSGEIIIAKSLTITGPASTPGITVTGNNARRIFGISSGTVELSGLTLSNGYENGLTGNAGLGDGGAIYVAAAAVVTVANCTFSSNRAVSEGGAIRNDGVLTVTSSTLSGNSGSTNSGSIHNRGTLTITSSTISGNSSLGSSGTNGGGGLSNFDGGTLTITNSTISGNTSSRVGGGINNAAGTVTVTNSTVTGNRASVSGGGIYAEQSTLNLSNSIVAGNSASSLSRSGPDIAGKVVSGDYNLVQNTHATLTGTHNITGQPASLAPLAENGGPTKTHALLAGSFAINTGDPAFNTGTTPNDQRGSNYPRQKSNAIDIGAFESAFTSHALLAKNVTFTTSPNIALSGRLPVSGGEPEDTRTYSIVTGTLPDGLTLDVATGIISGTPTSPSYTTLTFKATDNHLSESNTATLIVNVIDPAALVVTSNSDTTNATDGVITLREAVAYANSGNAGANPEITFSVTGIIDTLSPAITISNNVTITGPGASNLTISGFGNVTTSRSAVSIFKISGGTVGISGLTLKDGLGNGIPRQVYNPNTGSYYTITEYFGGAIYMTGGTVTIADTTLSNNTAQYGGAICVNGGSLTVTGSTISNNTLSTNDQGGGIYLESGSMTVTNSTISGNTAGYGAGILSSGGGTMAITNSTVSGNTARNVVETVTVTCGTAEACNNPPSGFTCSGTQCTGPISSNGVGAGIYNAGASVTVTNSTISGNIAQGWGRNNLHGGGGILNRSTLTVANSTITGNSAQFGGGIYADLGTLNLSNSIVAGNINSTISYYPSSGPDISGTLATGDYNLVQNTSGATLSGTHNITGQDPKLGLLSSNGGPTKTHLLFAGSPAIDAGDPNFDTTNTPYDQRGIGYARVRNSPIDIGAIESETFQSSSFIVNTLADHDDGTCDATDCTLREAVSSASLGGTITFSVTGTIILTGGDLVIARDLSIQGPATAPGITVSGNNASRIFRIAAGTVNLSYLTLTGGKSTSTSTPASTGGAIDISAGTVNLSNSTLRNNHAVNSGGAIRNATNATLTVTNCTLYGNWALDFAGAIRNGGTLTVANSTITGSTVSSASGNGGGIHTSGTSPVTLTNSIVAGNSAANARDVFGTISSANYNLIQNTSGATITGANNITGQAPKLDTLKSNGGPTATMVLLAGSPALDAGDPNFDTTNTPYDQRGIGYARKSGSAIDIGAFELQIAPPALADLTVVKTHAGNFTQGDTEKTYSITVINSGTGATSGDVSVVDTLPIGLTATAITGTGWTCTLENLSCTRSDALAAGASYSIITLTVSVDANAPSSVTNTVSVTGAGEADTGNNTASDPTTINAAPTYSISGAIRYGITEANQPEQFVSGVLLSATGTTSTSADSGGAAGAYTLNELTAGGNYTVTPSKSGEIKGINSLDATRIQQHRVGLITLTPNQLIAADTDGSGAVNSLDATRIQQRAVGITAQNIIGQWKFVPASRQYNALSSNQSGQDYQAVLVGEVSGNWASAVNFADDSETNEEILPKQDVQSDAIGRFENELSEQIAQRMNESADSQSNESKSESAIAGGIAVNVSLPSNATVSTGSSITIPVTVGRVQIAQAIESFDFTVFYDPAVLQPANPAGSNTGTLSANCSVLANSPLSGRVVVSGACATAITTTTGGVLYNLQFNVIGTSGQRTGLLFNNPSTGTQMFQFNSGNPAANTTNGLFSVLGPTATSVTVSGKVTNNQGRGIRNVLITMIDSAGRVQTAQTTAFGYYKFEAVAAGETVTLTAKARQFRFNQPTIVRTTNESVSNADFVSEQ